MKEKNARTLELCHMTAAEKQAYNKEYYQNNKQYWVDYYKYGTTRPRVSSGNKNSIQSNVMDALKRSGYSSKDGLSLLRSKGLDVEQAYKLLQGGGSIEDMLSGQIDKSLQNFSSMSDAQIEKALRRSTDFAVDYISKNEDKLAKMAVDSLEEIGRASIGVGKKILSEIGSRAKKSLQSSWEMGVDQIVSAGKGVLGKLKSLF